MKPGTRTTLSLVSLGLQFVALTSALGAISFFGRLLAAFVEKHNGEFVVPVPTELLLGHPGFAKLILIALFAASVVCFAFTRLKMKDEADRLAVQSVVYGAVWYVSVIYVGGVLMAMALPYFALNHP